MSSPARIEDILARDGVFISTTSGVSMFPMLRDRQDTVIVRTYSGRLKKYDVVLYRKGNQYVLHRILKVLPASYIIRGDNCFQKEYDITDNDILGVLREFYRGDKKVELSGFRYRLYICFLPVINLWNRLRRTFHDAKAK